MQTCWPSWARDRSDKRLSAPNDSVLFIANGAYGGRLLRTTDRGLTWTLPSAHAAPAGQISFFSAQSGLVCYDSSATLPARVRGQVRVTTDGGATWGPPRSRPTGQTVFTSPTQGYVFQPRAGGVMLIYRTSTAGQTWQALDSLVGLPDPGQKWVASVASPNTAYLFLTRTGVPGVLDAGAFQVRLGQGSWRARPLPQPPTWFPADYAWPREARFTDDSTGAVIYTDLTPTRLLTTTNGGRTWAVRPLDSDDGQFEASIGDNQHFLYHLRAVGNQSLTLYSSFGEVKMRDYTVPPAGPDTTGFSAAPSDMFRESASRLLLLPSGAGWAIGGSGRIYYTTNFGRTFTLRSRVLILGDPLELDFPDPSHGWVAGWRADDLLRTSDAGTTWARVGLPGTGLHLTAAAFPDADTLVLARVDRTNTPDLLHSTNAGQTWTTTAIPGNAEIRDIRFGGGARRGLAVGDGGVILRTVDGGQSWQSVASGTTSTLHHVTWADPMTAVVSTAQSIRKSQDGGLTWQALPAVPIAFPGGQSIGAIGFPTPQLGFALIQPAQGNTPSQLYRTTDGGQSWQSVAGAFRVRYEPTIQPVRFSFSSAQHGWINGYATQDSGRSWTAVRYAADALGHLTTTVDADNAFMLLSYDCDYGARLNSSEVVRYSKHFLRTAPLPTTTLTTGSTHSIAFTMEGEFAPVERDFRVELSNALGRFRAGQTTTIGQGTASPISVTIPANQPLGTRYRLRVVRADGSVIGADNGQDLTLQRATGLAPEAEVLAAPRLFPNPAQRTVTIAFADGAQAGRTVRLLDLAGRTVLAVPATAAELAVSLTGVPAGCYLVQVRSADGRAHTQRLLVQL